jgi:hypothetical protein
VGRRALESLQRFVSDATRRTAPLGADAEITRRADELVTPSHRGMSSVERLDVYREQYWSRHLPSLEEDYPTLMWVLGGSDRFRELATGYLGACPPRTWDLRRLGANLPAYVSANSPWRDDALARDAAHLDWAFMETFDAPDAPAFDPSVLSTAPEEAWPAARIVLHPSIRRLVLAHPAHELRTAVQSKADDASGAPPRPPPMQTHVVVWRDRAFQLRSAAVDPMAFELLAALEAGAPLGEACEAVAREAGAADANAFGPRVGEWFQQWTAEGWVTAVRFSATTTSSA